MKRVTGKLFLGLALITGVLNTLSADQKIQDDLIVVGSQCLGVDCVNGENFGYDTIRLKENNLRIHFIDTSSSSSFPGEDWQITINDSVNGGLNYFGIEDVTSGTKPFYIMGSAPDNSLYVSTYGRIGLGTNAPEVKLHMKDSNTPTIRLEQDTRAGWPAQTWDIGANESAFFVRDTTNGGILPLRIAAGARNSSLYIARDGDIGLGTTTPDVGLDMVSSIPAIRMGNTNDYNGNGSWSLYAYTNEFSIGQSENGSYTSIFHIERNSPTKSLVIKPDKVSILKGLDVNESVSIGGSLTVSGNILSLGSVFNASDRNLKENIIKVNDNDILKKVDSLDISFWNYKKENKSIRHIGPMAQDFYKIFKVGVDNKHISSLDAAAVAIASVKALNKKLKEKDEEIAALQTQIEELKKVEARIAKIEAFMTLNANMPTKSKVDKIVQKKYQDPEDGIEVTNSSVDKSAENQNINRNLDNGRDPNPNRE